VSAVESPENPFVDKKISEAVGDSELNINVTSNLFQAMSRGDVIIDFSTPESALECLKISKQKELPVVIGTTGFNKKQFDEIKTFSKFLPIVLTSNMSIGVNALAGLIGKRSLTLGDDYDVHISEIHHRNKKDAPSGTALYLASSIASAKNKNLAELLTSSKGKADSRGKISICSARAGDIAGEHTVIFAGPEERVEVTHRASDNIIFARGALQAARWIIEKAPGMYSMMDVLELK
jgi:4-hydroxy-tetrahydrodipicolinate reductase